MSNIQAVINSIPEDRIALASVSSEYSYRSIKALVVKNKDVLEQLKDSSVAINGRGRLEFALLLSMLDGVVSKILFLPSDIDSSLHAQYYNEVNTEFEVYLENDTLLHREISSSYEKERISEQPTQWIIPTSGTTNIPKLVSHSFASLTRTTKQNSDLGAKYRWGLVFDIYRFSGIQVFLQSLLSGSTLIIAEADQKMSEILNLLVGKRCNALSATPSFWRKVLMSKEANALNIDRITLGGEIADKNILKALKAKFPLAKISHIYASTEVGVGFSVTDGEAGFPSSYLSGGLENIRMKIDSDGLLWIAPVNQGQSYVSKSDMFDSDGFINTGDLVKQEDQRVYFLGRDSGAINVGGNKVQPEEVESTLLNTGLLSAAYVYAKSNPMMGALVCADVVLNDETADKKEAKSDILKFCREQLEGFKVPAIIKFVTELQTTQSGKLKRNTK